MMSSLSVITTLLCSTASGDYHQILATESACYSATAFSTDYNFNAPAAGDVVGVALEYLSGGVTCDHRNFPHDAWGCEGWGNDRIFMNVLQINDGGTGYRIYPTSSTEGVSEFGTWNCPNGCTVRYSSFSGYDASSPTLEWLDEGNPIAVTAEDIFSIQYSEGCCGNSNDDNNGTGCAKVFFYYDGNAHTDNPTNDHTAEPTSEPTAEPTSEPTAEPTSEPTAEPTNDPTSEPSNDPTPAPSEQPTVGQTDDPTAGPTRDPTADPTKQPTMDPPVDPTADPMLDPTTYPTTVPTADPTAEPTANPTTDPTPIPSSDPRTSPTVFPAVEPSEAPTYEPTREPTADPTFDLKTYLNTDPANVPEAELTTDQTVHPTNDPTVSLSANSTSGSQVPADSTEVSNADLTKEASSTLLWSKRLTLGIGAAALLLVTVGVRCIHRRKIRSANPAAKENDIDCIMTPATHVVVATVTSVDYAGSVEMGQV